MEVLMGIIVSGCLGYLITEMNTLQSDIKIINQEVFEIKNLIHKKRRTDVE